MMARHRRVARVLSICVLAGMLLVAGSAAAFPPTPGWGCYWGKINASGSAAGMCYGDYGPLGQVYKDGVVSFLTLPDRPISWAFDINDRGQVAGNSWDLNWRSLPFVWQDGVLTLLPTMGGDSGEAWGINNRGDVIGMSSDAEGNWYNTLWRAGRPVDIARLGCPIAPAAINNRRAMVGADSTGHMILCQNGGSTDLTPNPEGWYYPLAINDRMQIVGYIDNYPQPRQMFLWDNGVLTDLGSLGNFPNDWSRPEDINNLGQIVGQSYDSEGHIRAFLWQNGVMSDITPVGYRDAMASGINIAGQIVGAAEGQAWIWPQPR